MKTTVQPSDYHRLFLKKKNFETKIIGFVQFSLLLLFLVFWEISARLGFTDSFIFSSPSKLFFCCKEMILSGFLANHMIITLSETFLSFLFVMTLSLISAVLLWRFPILSRILEPYLVILNSLPKSALAPLLIVWLGANTRTIIVTGISVSIFGSILTLYLTFTSVDPEKIKLIQTLGGNRFHVLTKLILPYSLPSFIGLMKVNIGLCLVGVVIGEFISSKSGLGYLIIYGSQVFKLDWVILSILILCFFAYLFYQSLCMLEATVSKHHK